MDEKLRSYYFLAGRLHHINAVELDDGGNAVGCSCGWLYYGLVRTEAATMVGRQHIENKAREIYYHFEGQTPP